MRERVVGVVKDRRATEIGQLGQNKKVSFSIPSEVAVNEE